MSDDDALYEVRVRRYAGERFGRWWELWFDDRRITGGYAWGQWGASVAARFAKRRHERHRRNKEEGHVVIPLKDRRR